MHCGACVGGGGLGRNAACATLFNIDHVVKRIVAFTVTFSLRFISVILFLYHMAKLIVIFFFIILASSE